MGLLIRHYLHTEPGQDLDTLQQQYTEALWLEEREISMMATAIGRALGGK
ncbi:MAG: hypothetical protein PHC49_18335 [Desulfuromonadaceae bacterium]|nr:hypothetical protein [Desulfuromonadaceae bacterium]